MIVPKSKPIRISILSGGMEHFSLDSLKTKFAEEDIGCILYSLSKWLVQCGEQNKGERIKDVINKNTAYEDRMVNICKIIFDDLTLENVSSMAEIAEVWKAKSEYNWNYEHEKKRAETHIEYISGRDDILNNLNTNEFDAILCEFEKGQSVPDERIDSIGSEELQKVLKLCNNLIRSAVCGNMYHSLANDSFFATPVWSKQESPYNKSILFAVYKYRGEIKKVKEIMEDNNRTESVGYSVVCSIVNSDSNIEYEISHLNVNEQIKASLKKVVENNWMTFCNCISIICNYCIR